MKVTMMLADYAIVADGKLTIVGGGWSLIGPEPSPSALAVKIEVPWDRANEKHTARAELLTADGDPVAANKRTDGVPVQEEEGVRVEAEFETGRPAGLKAGSPLDFMFAVNFPPQPLEPGQRYEWKLSIDGQTQEDWSVAFTVRPNPPVAVRRAS